MRSSVPMRRSKRGTRAQREAQAERCWEGDPSDAGSVEGRGCTSPSLNQAAASAQKREKSHRPGWSEAPASLAACSRVLGRF